MKKLGQEIPILVCQRRQLGDSNIEGYASYCRHCCTKPEWKSIENGPGENWTLVTHMCTPLPTKYEQLHILHGLSKI